MAHFENEELKVSFDLPDKPNVLDILTYDSTRMEHYGEKAILILWESIKPLIQNWTCEAMPDKDSDLSSVNSDKALDAAYAVEWSAFRGSDWRKGLDVIPKN